MQDAEDFDRASLDDVEGKIFAHDDLPNPSPEIVARHSRARLRRQQLETRREPVEQTVCATGIVLGDVEPDSDQSSSACEDLRTFAVTPCAARGAAAPPP